MIHINSPRALILLMLYAALSNIVLAQTLTSATIVGTVSDSSGASVSHANVRITQADTEAVRTTTTGAAGDYRFPFLKPGDYTVKAEGEGLNSAPIHVQLLVGKEESVNIILGLQSVQQSVDVTTASILLQAENGNQVTSYSQQYIENTPVNGGDITNVAFTTPGLRLNVGGGNANFNVNGLPFNSVLFTMNGADIVEPYNLNNKSGASNNTLGANDVAEAAVVVNAYSAQYGREAGAQVNYISKSGTNQFHGNLVENYNGEFLNANDYFNKLNNTPRARSVANQYAASIGGPILRNKLAFFVNTEGLRYALPSSGVVSLPSPTLQQYILTHVPASSLPIYQSLFKLYNSAPGIGRAVPVTNGNLPLQDSSGHLGCGRQTFTGTYVNGNSGPRFGVDTPCAVAFGTTASSINTEYFISGRLDYSINDKQKIYFRISRDAGAQASFTSPISPVYNRQSVQPWVIPQLNYTYAITPNLVNNFILNGNWYSAITGPANFSLAQTDLPTAFGFADGGANGSNTTNGGPTSTTAVNSTTGFAGIGPSLPVGRRGQQLGIIDDLSWSVKRHTLQAGMNDRNNRISDSSIASGSVVGTYNFSDLTDFTVGIVNSTSKGSAYTQSFPLLQTVHTRLNSLGFYVQDEWKARRNLNLTYGVRFELQGNPSCKENCFSRANTAFLTPGYQAGLSVPYNATLQTGLHKDFKDFEGIVTEPRFAFAYSPLGDGKTVIRGGVGLFANTIQGSITANVFGNAPNKFSPIVSSGTVGLTSDPGSSQAAATESNQVFQEGFAQGSTLPQLRAAVPAGTTFATPTLYVNPNFFRTIKVLEWSAELEQPLTTHDVVSFSYSGNHGYDEPLSNAAANAYASNASLYPNGFGGLPISAPDPRFSTVTQISNAGYSNYEGVTVTERHALAHNFQGQIGYTWSHALQFGTIFDPPLFSQGDASQSTGSYGPTNFDTRHNLEADLLYTEPRLRGKLLNATAGGWTVGGKLYRYSGRPFSVTNSLIQSSLVASGQTNNFPSSTLILADTLDQNALGTGCGKSAVKSACLKTSQFASVVTASNPGGQRDFGNTAPNSFRGPGFFSIAAQLTKTIPVTEHTYFDIGADAYNLLNHTNLAVPNSNAGGSGFGLITSTVSSPTSIYGTGQGAIVSGACLSSLASSSSRHIKRHRGEIMKKLSITFSMLLIPGMFLAQSERLTIDDLLSAGSRRGGVELSPDGRLFAREENGQIALVPVNGGQANVITSSPKPKSELQWSHDGKHIAYISEGDVWIVASEGGQPQRLTHDPAGPGDPRGATDHHPRWNPNGHWILFESGRKGFNELYVVSEDGAQEKLLAATEIYTGSDIIANTASDRGDAVSSDRFDPEPLWSPDGTRISYTERSRQFFSGKLKVLPFDQKTGSASGPAIDLYTAKNDPGGAWAINTAAWSPDSATLTVVLQSTGWDKLWQIPATGGTPKQLTKGTGEDENPVYSPDGRWIVFSSNRDLPEERHLWVVPAVGGQPHRLTDLKGIETNPQWSSDSGSIYFFRTTALRAGASYVADTSGKRDPRLLEPSQPSKYEGLGITPEVAHFKGKDGLALAGILYKPADYRPGKRYPAVIWAHGGPEGQVVLSLNPWSLFLAQQGYVVLEPNFRGSTGYGERFRNANVEDSGGGEIDDIGASVKYLVDTGLVDAKRVGIGGGSHGGTVVANAVTKLPDTFAAGIEMFGVVDRALFLQYTNRNSKIRWETKMGGTPEEKPAVYRKANVLPDVEVIKTPLLILHGEEDPQVPPQESAEFAEALKKAGKTYLYFTYPNEGHGFQQREHRKDSYERQLTFLDKYLKDSAASQ